MNTDKLAINWQNFARVRLQLKFAFTIRPFICQSARWPQIILIYFVTQHRHVLCRVYTCRLDNQVPNEKLV